MGSIKSFLNDKVNEYEFNKFVKELNDRNEFTTLSSINNKSHIKYFQKYFESDGLNVKFYLIEDKYISKNYLTDFSYYYSTCFSDYKNKCTRIHLFTFSIDNKDSFIEELEKGIIRENKTSKTFWEKNYLGFIVVNPIPNTFIGFTLLRTYNHNHLNNNREFWGTKNYQVHLFGKVIELNTLAFHEQDTNVGACATISIWTVFQVASEDYHVNQKSPFEITKDAGLINFNGQRMIPNNGLVPSAMCTAITKNNLETEVVDFWELNEKNKTNFNKYIKKWIYAYSTLKLPLILIMDVPYACGIDEDNFVGHAISVCGYSMGENHIRINRKNIIHKSDRIEKIFAHDDQFGPFVKIEFFNRNKLITPWSDILNNKNKAVLKALIIPVYPQIKISLKNIESIVINLDVILKLNLIIEKDFLFQWSTKLYFSEDYKVKLKNKERFDFVSKEKDAYQKFIFCSQSFPKYIWVSTVSLKNKNKEIELISFIFDATGLVSTRLLLHVFFYFPKMKDEFESFLKDISGTGYDYCVELFEELISGKEKNNFYI